MRIDRIGLLCASVYTAISDADILGLPVLIITADVADAVTKAVQSAFAARARSRALLSAAKRAVEIAIEQGEEQALAWLAGSGIGRAEIMRDQLRAALKEPLVHFLLAGLALFLFFAWRGDAIDPESRTITITEAQVERLAAGWTQTWQRPPTQAEIDGLIRDHVKEEVYYREGIRLGLDQDDTIIRRRIRSKMEFLASSELENEAPDDATLQALLDKSPKAYAADARYSFDQIYLATQDEAAARARATQILAALNTGTDWQKLGDSISLPRSPDNVDRTRIASDFGDEFAASLAGLKAGSWSGPVASGFGLHIVRIRTAQASSKPRLADVRQKLENDWRAQTVKDREAKAYQALLDSYTIRIAKP